MSDTLTAGAQLRQRIEAELAERELDLDSREAELLDRACTTADAIEALEAAVERDGPTVTGSRGQTVVHPALIEARQQKTVLLRLLNSIDLDGDSTPPASPSARGRAAAQARWRRNPSLKRQASE